jgi:hypothetical protein
MQDTRNNSRLARIHRRPLPKIFEDSPLHRILQHMYEALNINDNKN